MEKSGKVDIPQEQLLELLDKRQEIISSMVAHIKVNTAALAKLADKDTISGDTLTPILQNTYEYTNHLIQKANELTIQLQELSSSENTGE